MITVIFHPSFMKDEGVSSLTRGHREGEDTLSLHTTTSLGLLCFITNISYLVRTRQYLLSVPSILKSLLTALS